MIGMMSMMTTMTITKGSGAMAEVFSKKRSPVFFTVKSMTRAAEIGRHNSEVHKVVERECEPERAGEEQKLMETEDGKEEVKDQTTMLQ